MFLFLKSHSDFRLIFDPQQPDLGASQLVECEWLDFYASVVEAIMPNALKPLEKGALLSMFADSDHAGDTVSQCF